MISKRILFAMTLVICLATAGVVAGQDDGCGTVVPQGMIDYELNRIATGWDYSQLAEPSMAAVTIPLAIHIVRTTAGTGGLSSADLTQAMADVDMQYAPMNITFCIKGAVDYINSDLYYYNTTTSTTWNALRTTNVVDSAINVYFIPNASGFPWCGLSSFTSSAVQGIIMLNGCSGSGSQATLSHEIGHYFDLYHTHEPAFGIECPDETNCATAGDLLCDTPADPRLQTSSGWHVSNWPACVYDNYASTPPGCGGVYNPQTNNLMSYSQHACRDFFSLQQRSKALNTLNTLRTELLGGCGGTPVISIFPTNYSLALAIGEVTLRDLIITNSGNSALNYAISLIEKPAGSTITEIVVPELIEAWTDKELAAIDSRNQKRNMLGFDDTSEDILGDVSAVQPREFFPDAGDARGGALLPTASLVTSFPDYSGNTHPMSIAFDGTYYWVVGGGSPTGEVAQLNASFGLVTTQIVNLDCRSVVYNPADGQVYIKSFTNNGLYRLHTAPFDGGVDQIFINQFQDPQSNVCLSPDGQFMFDHLNGLVIKYNFLTGAFVDSIVLNLQHSTVSPRGYELVHTGSYLLTIAANTIYAYDPITGAFVDSSVIPGITTYEWSPAYTNGMYFVTNSAEDTWYAYMIDAGSGPAWMSANLSGGSIPGGGVDTIQLTFDATGLTAGSYFADIMVSSNDPVTPSQIVPVAMLIAGVPVISVSPGSLDQTLPLGGNASQTMTVSNTGTGDLNYLIYHNELPKLLQVPEHPIVQPNNVGMIGTLEASVADVAYTVRQESITIGKSSAAAIDILLMHSSGFAPHADTLAAHLITYPDIGLVTLFDCQVGTPTLAQMQSYDAVLMTTDIGYANMTLASETVAQYLDGGGKVIISTFGWSNQGANTINGRLLTNYSPFQVGGATLYATANLGTTAAGHPLFNGVTTLTAHYRDNVTLSTGAGLLGTWDDSHLMAAQKGNVLGLNFAVHVSSITDASLGWTGDGFALTHNALIYMTNTSWLSYVPITGTVSPGGSDVVSVGFDAAGLASGDYYADMFVASNDPVTPSVNVPAHLAVGGTPIISVVPDSLNESLPLGGASSQPMTISNSGTGALNVSITVAQTSPGPAAVSAILERHEANYIAAGSSVMPLASNTSNGSAGRQTGIDQPIPQLSTADFAEKSGSWISKTPMDSSRAQHGIVAHPNGNIYAFGGYGLTGDVGVLEVFNTVTNSWSLGASLPGPDRGMATAIDTNGFIYSFGGISFQSYRYNPGTNVWTAITNMPSGRAWEGAAATGHDGKIYLFGGEETETTVQIYDPGTDTWSSGATMPTGHLQHGVVTGPAGLIYVMGGRLLAGDTIISVVDVYNPTTNTWSSGAPMPTGRSQFGIALGGDGRIYTIGGKQDYYNSTPPYHNEVEVYDPVTNSWQAGPSLPTALGEIDATVSGGNIYISGGIDSTGFRSATLMLSTLGWLTINPIVSTVPPGGSQNLSANFDASSLGAGDYYADVRINSDDPITPLVIVPAHLLVGGTPIIVVSLSDSLVDTLVVGDTSHQLVTISNTGTGGLNYAIYDNMLPKSLPVPENPAVYAVREIMGSAFSSEVTDAVVTRRREAFQSFGSSNAVGTSVLILYAYTSSPYPGADSMAARLSAYPDIGTVSTFDCYVATPTVAQLSAYDVVIVGTDATYLDFPAACENVSVFLDGGGKVILVGGSWFGPPFGIVGRLLTDYSPFQVASSGGLYATASIGSFTVWHPLFNGFSALSAYFRDNVSLSMGAGLLGTWNDGHLMAAEKGNVIALNFAAELPISVHGSGWTGDGWTLVHNAVAYLTAASWLSYAPNTGTISPGGSQVVDVLFDATALSAGDYNAMMHITNNDPVSLDVALPAHLLVTSGSCCVNRGDMDGSGGPIPVDISDLTLFSDYMFMGGPPPVCMDEADANSDGSPDITDLTFIVDFMFHGGAAPGPCF